MAKEEDFRSFHAPSYYRFLSNFRFYSSGEKEVPKETIFIGGNHECWEHLAKYPEGGNLIDKVYYMGRSGIIERFGLRIGGISGVYSPKNFMVPHSQKSPFQKNSTYFNNEDIEKMKKSGNLDILLLHDWPQGITMRGDLSSICPRRRFDPPEKAHELGNPYFTELIKEISPEYTFCGHMHFYFRAKFPTKQGPKHVICLGIIGEDERNMFVLGVKDKKITEVEAREE
jgi:lariat debranching enzyme